MDVRAFPEAVNDAIGKTTMDVLHELGNSDDLTRRIHSSYLAFLRRADSYAQQFDVPILKMRTKALSAI